MVIVSVTETKIGGLFELEAARHKEPHSYYNPHSYAARHKVLDADALVAA
jgi:hypothetical protein